MGVRKLVHGPEIEGQGGGAVVGPVPAGAVGGGALGGEVRGGRGAGAMVAFKGAGAAGCCSGYPCFKVLGGQGQWEGDAWGVRLVLICDLERVTHLLHVDRAFVQ